MAESINRGGKKGQSAIDPTLENMWNIDASEIPFEVDTQVNMGEPISLADSSVDLLLPDAEAEPIVSPRLKPRVSPTEPQLPGAEAIHDYLSAHSDLVLDEEGLAQAATELAECLSPPELELAFHAMTFRDLSHLHPGSQVPALPQDRQDHLDGCERCQRLLQAAVPPPERLGALARQLRDVARANPVERPSQPAAKPGFGKWTALVLIWVVSLGVAVAVGTMLWLRS